MRHSGYRQHGGFNPGGKQGPPTSPQAARATRPAHARSAAQCAKAFQRDLADLSAQMAPWITAPDHKRIRKLEARIDRTVAEWESALGKDHPVRGRQPLP